MKKTITLLLFLISFCVSAQITFQKTYGGTGYEYGYSAKQTSDGGYIVVGYTNSFGAGGVDVYLIKTNSTGDTLWTKTFGGAGTDEGHDVEQTTDGGYVIAGFTNSFGAGNYDIYLIKTDAAGNLLWSKTYVGTISIRCDEVQQTTDGGYIINLQYSGIIKTDSNGNLVWAKYFNSTYSTTPYSVAQTNDGGFIIAGDRDTSSSAWYEQLNLIKTDSSGSILWSKRYFDDSHGYASDVKQTNDGGYVITGTSRRIPPDNYYIYFIKTDGSGNLNWFKIIRVVSVQSGWSVQQTTDGGYIVSGAALFSFGEDVCLFRFDGSGTLLWSRRLGAIGADDWSYSIQQTNDGGYIINGPTFGFGAGSGEVYLIKTDSSGISGCYENIISPVITSPAVTIINVTTTDSPLALTVTNPSTIVGSGAIVTTLCPIPTSNNESTEKENLISLSPNPATSELRIQNPEFRIEEINIYDVLGRTVLSKPQTSNLKPETTTLDISSLSTGLYFLQLKASGGERVARFVKQ